MTIFTPATTAQLLSTSFIAFVTRNAPTPAPASPPKPLAA